MQSLDLDRNFTVAKLDNEIRILIYESHAASVGSFWIWYGVGSRNETPGWTGISHWVEHMLFKGTPTYPKEALTRIIERLGGRWNAFTSKDYTAYHHVLPAQHLGVAIGLEADRMRHTIFQPEEVERERTVILAEREGGENHPSFYLHEETDALAFKVHPYRQPVIGWKNDLRRITRDDLYAHYRAFYHPRNATVVVVGAVEPDEILGELRGAFEDIDPGPEIPPVRAEEPPQEGERRVVLQRPGGATAYIQIAFPTQSAKGPNWPAQVVLDGVLSGFVGVRGIDEGGLTRSSRLYRTLIDRGLATEAGSGVSASVDPGLARISAVVRSGVPVQTVENAILEVLDDLTKREVSGAELERVKRQAEAHFVYARDGVHRLAYAIGAYAMVDASDTFFELQKRVRTVTTADIQEAAARTFAVRRRTVGWYLPEEGASAAATAAAVRLPSPRGETW